MQPRRLDQILANYGYCSRSEAKVWIRNGRVTINGKTATEAEKKAAPDLVQVDGSAIECPAGILALLHKPAGYVCSHDAAEGPSIYDLLPAQWLRRNPAVTTIGRLDKDTTGALLVTDLGDLVHRWTSPKHKVAKVYEVTVNADVSPSLVDLFAAGTLLLEGEEKPCAPARLEIVSPREARLGLTEGRYHQVKRMFASQGCEVIRLHRSRFGEFELGDLPAGQWRLLPLPQA
jgi:16S rRNA pseudouridine516 synthase